MFFVWILRAIRDIFCGNIGNEYGVQIFLFEIWHAKLDILPLASKIHYIFSYGQILGQRREKEEFVNKLSNFRPWSMWTLKNSLAEESRNQSRVNGYVFEDLVGLSLFKLCVYRRVPGEGRGLAPALQHHLPRLRPAHHLRQGGRPHTTAVCTTTVCTTTVCSTTVCTTTVCTTTVCTTVPIC